MKAWSSAAAGCLALFLMSCSDGAKLLQSTDNGGVVVYPFKGDNHLTSSFRRDAFRVIEKQCPAGYSIVKEGETKGRTRVASPVAGAEEAVRERRWGIEFRCK
jgi:hypothetical protein